MKKVLFIADVVLGVSSNLRGFINEFEIVSILILVIRLT